MWDKIADLCRINRLFGRQNLVGGPRPEMERSGKWPKVRYEHLRLFPRCIVCGTLEDPEVHHVNPYHLYPDEELDPENLVTMCGQNAYGHHLRVGHLDLWRDWNPNVREIAAAMLATRRLRDERLSTVRFSSKPVA